MESRPAMWFATDPAIGKRTERQSVSPTCGFGWALVTVGRHRQGSCPRPYLSNSIP
jgi:hypothetical protein